MYSRTFRRGFIYVSSLAVTPNKQEKEENTKRQKIVTYRRTSDDDFAEKICTHQKLPTLSSPRKQRPSPCQQASRNSQMRKTKVQNRLNRCTNFNTSIRGTVPQNVIPLNISVRHTGTRRPHGSEQASDSFIAHYRNSTLHRVLRKTATKRTGKYSVVTEPTRVSCMPGKRCTTNALLWRPTGFGSPRQT